MSRIVSPLSPAVLRTSTASVVQTVETRAPLEPMAAALLAVAIDVIVAVAAPFGVALVFPPVPTVQPLVGHVAALAGLLVPLAAMAAGAYRHDLLFRRREQLGAAMQATVGALLVVTLSVALLSNRKPIPPEWAMTSATLVVAGIAAGRLALAGLLSGQAGHRFAQRAVIVGSGLCGARLLRLLRQLDERSLHIIGLLDDGADEAPGAVVEGTPVLGPTGQLFPLLQRGAVDEVVLALPWSEERRILGLIDQLTDYPVHVRLAPDLISYHFPRHVRADRRGHAMLQVATRPISGWSSVLKRAEDIVVAGMALILCAIPMALIALAIRLDSPGPVLFRQRRTGFNNREFEMLKFRTMHHHLSEYRIRQQTTRNDPRVTRVGAILRRTSLDELPQLFCVLRGDMSVVGPRPHAPGTRAGSRPFEQVVDRYAARHRVKPGLTGLAQVRGYRGETPTEDKLVRRVESDLEYIESWSLWLDVVILLRTLVIVLRTKNAY